MNPKSFFFGLTVTFLLQLVVNLLLLKWFKPLQGHTGFIFASMGGMLVFCITLYGAARMIVRSTLTRLFIQLIMVAVFVKILFCLALVVIYKQVFLPADHSFVWSFLFIYITSTIYEVIFLEKVGRQKHTPAS